MADPIFAVVTPFDESPVQSLDLSALHDLLQFLSARGVRRIIANGTTGEFPALTWEERRKVLETCRASFPGQVLAHVSSPCAAEVREALIHAREYADAALVLPPYYFAAPPAQGVVAFLAGIASAAPLPVYLYNFPRHTQVSLSPAMVQAVRERAPNVLGLKDSAGDLAQALEFKRVLGPEFEVYLGADGLAYRALEAGLQGSVTGGAQPVPEHLVGIAEAFAAGDLPASRQAQHFLDRWSAARKEIPLAEPAALKAALRERLPGFPRAVRPPFVAADGAAEERLREAVRGCLEGTN